MAAWPVVGAAYSKFYRATGKFLFGSFGRGGIVQFTQSKDSREYINIVACNRYRMDESGNAPGRQLRYGIRYGDYMHMVFLAALIAATPLPWKRRTWALVWGLILMQALVALKLSIIILDLLSDKPASLLILSPFWKNFVVTANLVLVRRFTTGFIIAFFIWVLVTFRRGDWFRLPSGRGNRKNIQTSLIDNPPGKE
jgi:hypothetical protein